jgi:hypothetical protein
VIDLTVGEAGVVLAEMDDHVLAGNVGCGDDGELVPRNMRWKRDRRDAAARDAAAYRGAVPHTGQRDVVHIPSLPQDLRATLLAEG